MNGKRFLAAALCVCMIFSLMGPGTAQAVNQKLIRKDLLFSQIDGSLLNLDTKKTSVTSDLSLTGLDPDDTVKIFIIMESPSVVETDGTAVVDETTTAQREQLEQEQASVISAIEAGALEGDSLDVSYSYTWLLNGVAAEVPYGTIAAIEETAGVKQVLIQPQYNVCSTEVADPDTISDGVMVGRETTWADGYTGKGITIAVIDTGLDTDHQNFAALSDDKLTETSATPETVAAVLDQLNASQRYEGLTVEDVYYSTKVAFGFNYCDDTLNITHDEDSMGTHGTHVAGIAAANKVEESEVVGVAPDAQLYIMKVFGVNGGAYSEDILAALEDALILGADVVNMSLGTDAGFTTSSEEVNAIYDRVAQTNTVLTISCGNNYTAGYTNNWGTDLNLTENTDNSVIGQPGIYNNVLSVASVENWMVQRVYIAIGDYKLGYGNTNSSYGLPEITSLTGEYEIAVVPGYGAAEDFEGLDLTGKIALIQRGVESFVDKIQNAEAAGAVGVMIYNNTSGEFGMDLTDIEATIPAISLTMADGECIIAALEEDPTLTVSFPEELAAIPTEDAYKMSDFSSWGATPSLTLEPDITAPGGNIYSTITDGEYGLMSGTSMAAPNMAGITALVSQYVKENFDLDSINYRAFVQALLTSAAGPLVYDSDSDLYYSPRQQGTGLANAYNSVKTHAYLTVSGMDVPKVELGDDADRTGAYSYSFQVVNFGDSDIYYALKTLVQTEDVLEEDGLYFMAGTPLALSASVAQSSGDLVLIHDVDDNGVTDSHDAYLIWKAANGDGDWTELSFRYDVNGDETADSDDVQAYLNALVGLESDADLEAQALKVRAGQTAEVTVELALSQEDRDYFAQYYPNGGYVEGFTFLEALTGGDVDLSLPYMGYYGNWDEPDILDNGFYWDYMNADEDEVVGNQHVSILWTNFYGEESLFYPGINAYVDEETSVEHISISPNGDGYADTIDDIYVSLLRNARYLTFRYYNADTGELYYEQTSEFVSKSCYSASYDQIIPAVYSWLDDIEFYDFKTPDGQDLPNNTHLLLQVEAIGDYEGATAESWEVGITVDLEAPELLSAVRVEDPETGNVSLELTFRDNLSVSAIGLYSSSGAETYYLDPVEDVEPDENGYQNYTVTYDITGITGKLAIMLADYALNESYYAINTAGEGTPYGDLVAYQYNVDAETSGWVSFDADVLENEVAITSDDGMDFVCAEYVGGYIFAQKDNGALYGFRYEDMLMDTFDIETTYITQLENTYQDLAYSYTDGQLYGLLVYEDSYGSTTNVYSINLHGEYYDADLWTTVEAYEETWYASRGDLYGLTMAIDDAGTIYILGMESSQVWDADKGAYVTEYSTAQLWRYAEQTVYGMTVKRFSKVGDTGLDMDYLQSMTWDHNTGTLYWARFWPVGFFDFECQLLEVDPLTAETTQVGTLTGETCGLFAPLTEETVASNSIYQNIPEMDADQIGRPVLRNSSVNLNLGASQKLTYSLDPWYTNHQDVIWTSNDETVVTVDSTGTVTAVGNGSAVITVTAKDDPTLYDTCTVHVTALSLNIEGLLSTLGAGIGSVEGVVRYQYSMDNGVATLTPGVSITAPDSMNYGLDLAASVYARGYIWASEYGNTGMIYMIDPETGEVQDVLEPVDGDMLFGITYNEELDTFTGIMNMYIYADLALTHEESAIMADSYDASTNSFNYHRLNLLPYLIESNTGFVTGEDGMGASSEIVLCGITTMPGGYVYTDTYKDYMGNWVYDGSVSYTATQTLVLLDNVGRLWYIDEVVGMTKTTDSYGNSTYTDANGSYIQSTGELRNGMMELEITDDEGNVTYNIFYIREIQETPLTDMFREGTMPRITYHFSDIAFGGYTDDGAPIFAMSLYDYWNSGLTNELYLYTPAVTAFDYSLYEEVEISPERFYSLGNTGDYQVIASIHSFEVLGGLD